MCSGQYCQRVFRYLSLEHDSGIWGYFYPCPHLAGDRPNLLELHNFPVKEGFKDVVAEIQNDYKQLGMRLLEDSNGLRVKGIEKARNGNPVDITDEILQQWLQGSGRLPVTWQTLIECLQDAKLTIAADCIEAALPQEDPSKEQQIQPLSCM